MPRLPVAYRTSDVEYIRMLHVPEGATAKQLLLVLNEQLDHCDAVLDRSSLRSNVVTRGKKEPVFSLPSQEAFFLIGTKKTVNMGNRLVEIHFEHAEPPARIPIRKERDNSPDLAPISIVVDEPIVEPAAAEEEPEPAAAEEEPGGLSWSDWLRGLLDRGPVEEEEEELPPEPPPVVLPPEPPPVPPPERTLLTRDLTTRETLELLKKLSLKRRKQDAEPVSSAYTYSPLPSLPALPSMFFNNQGAEPLSSVSGKANRPYPNHHILGTADHGRSSQAGSATDAFLQDEVVREEGGSATYLCLEPMDQPPERRLRAAEDIVIDARRARARAPRS